VWKPWSQSKPESPANPPEEKRTTGSAAFEEIASEFSEPARPQETRESERAPEQEKLVISIEWAQGALEGCFVPLAKLDHPAWALSPEEAQKGAPKMQAFLQAVTDRIAPAILARVVNKYPEFTDLLGMLAILGLAKYQQVRKLKLMDAHLRTEKTVASVDGRTTVTAESIHCDECGKDFPDRETAFAHLPCPGSGDLKN